MMGFFDRFAKKPIPPEEINWPGKEISRPLKDNNPKSKDQHRDNKTGQSEADE